MTRDGVEQNTVVTSIRLTPTLNDHFRKTAQAQGLTFQSALRMAVFEWVRCHGTNAKREKTQEIKA